jgi:hypothetical protein
MFWFKSSPKYTDVTRTDFRRLTYFYIFCCNMQNSECLASQYPKEMLADLIVVSKKLDSLAWKHCTTRLYMPLMNGFLARLPLPNIVIRLRSPIDIVGYANKAIELKKAIYEKWGNLEETEYFWPAKYPKDWNLFDNPNILFADTLYDFYELAIN